MLKKLLSLLHGADLQTRPAPNALLRNLESVHNTLQENRTIEEIMWEQEREQALMFATHLSLFFDMVPGEVIVLPEDAKSYKEIFFIGYKESYKEKEQVKESSIRICLVDSGEVAIVVHHMGSEAKSYEWNKENIDKYTQTITRWCEEPRTAQNRQSTVSLLQPSQVATTFEIIMGHIAQTVNLHKREIQHRIKAVEKRNRFCN